MEKVLSALLLPLIPMKWHSRSLPSWSKKDGKVIYTVKQEPYRVYDYLLKVIDTDAGKAALAAEGTDVSLEEKLTNLAKSLATYDYYSTEYFQYHEPYEEETKLLSLDGITQETLAEHKWMIGAYDQDSYTYKHYASSLQFKTTTNLLMMAQVEPDGKTPEISIWDIR